MGARVIALDVDAGRLESAKRFGADVAIKVDETDPVEAIRDLTGGLGAECTMDCSSSPTARSQAIQAARKWGRMAFVGEGGDVTIDVSSEMNRKQLTLLGCWTFSKNGQVDCAQFCAERKLDVDALFTHQWPLAEAEEAYRLFDTQTTGKGVLIPS